MAERGQGHPVGQSWTWINPHDNSASRCPEAQQNLGDLGQRDLLRTFQHSSSKPISADNLELR
jgi:hypothetical protein